MRSYRCLECGKAYFSASRIAFVCGACGGMQFATEDDAPEPARPPGRRVRAIGTGDHAVLEFGSDDEWMSLAVPFVREGVKRYERVICVLSPQQHRLLGLDLSFRERNSAEVVLGADQYGDTFDMNRTLDAYAAELASPPRPVRVFAIMDAIVEAGVDPPALLTYEALAHRRLVNERTSIICAYDARRTSQRLLESARRTHPIRAAAGGGFEDNPRFEPAAGNG